MSVLRVWGSVVSRAIAHAVRRWWMLLMCRRAACVSEWRKLRWRSTPKPERLLFPLFEIAACPTIKLSEIKARRFHIIDRRPWGCVEVKDEEFVCRVPEETLGV
jgi:hypothetical protein